jgi:hypothetical protein
MKKILALPMLLALVGGCAPMPYWTLTDDANGVLKSTSFEMTVPAGWTRTTTADTWEQVRSTTRPRPCCSSGDRQSGWRRHPGDHGHSPLSRYRVPDDQEEEQRHMLPLEAADLYVSELRKRSGLERLRVLSNKPAQINGKQGFELVMEFKNDDGLRIRIVSNGFVDKNRLLTRSTIRAPGAFLF